MDRAFKQRGELTQLALDGTVLSGYSYDPAGSLTMKQLENGTSTSFFHDAASRLTGMAYSGGLGGISQNGSLGYTLNELGNRTAPSSGSNSSKHGVTLA